MPIVDLALAKGALNTKDQQRLLEKVGRIAIDYEGLSGSKFAEAFTWTYLPERPAAHVSQVSGPPAKASIASRFDG